MQKVEHVSVDGLKMEIKAGQCSYGPSGVRKTFKGLTMDQCQQELSAAHKDDAAVTGGEFSLDSRNLCWLLAGVDGVKHPLKPNFKYQCVRIRSGTSDQSAPSTQSTQSTQRVDEEPNSPVIMETGMCDYATGRVKIGLKGLSVQDCKQELIKARREDGSIDGAEASMDHRHLCWLVTGARGVKHPHLPDPKFRCLRFRDRGPDARVDAGSRDATSNAPESEGQSDKQVKDPSEGQPAQGTPQTAAAPGQDPEAKDSSVRAASNRKERSQREPPGDDVEAGVDTTSAAEPPGNAPGEGIKMLQGKCDFPAGGVRSVLLLQPVSRCHFARSASCGHMRPAQAVAQCGSSLGGLWTLPPVGVRGQKTSLPTSDVSAFGPP